MRTRVFFNFACIALFAGVVGFTYQQPATGELAENHYKNIVVFKGMPASVVRPAMDGMTAALGVKCSFCHVVDAKGEFQPEKDDKDEKKTARQMYTMMKKINDDNFNGRMQVTCATCHQGHSSPNRIPPIGQPASEDRGPGGPGAAADSMPKADDLVAKYIDAIGGSSKVDQIKTLSMKANIKSSDFNATSEIYAKAPNKVMAVVVFPQGTFTQSYDGTTGWQQFRTDKETLGGSELESLKGSSPLFYINPKLAYSTFRRVRKDTLYGKEVYVVDVQPQETGPRIRLYFDATTNLLSRVWYGTQTIVGLVPATEDYDDYRDVGGVKIPFKVTDTSGDGMRTSEYSEIKVNEDIPDSKFTMPK